MFVKPANSGSSVGISKALNKDELILAIEAAREEDEKIIVEQMIKGKEVECAVIGNEEPMASIVGEIDPGADFYDYSAKVVRSSLPVVIQNTDRLHQSTDFCNTTFSSHTAMMQESATSGNMSAGSKFTGRIQNTEMLHGNTDFAGLLS